MFNRRVSAATAKLTTKIAALDTINSLAILTVSTHQEPEPRDSEEAVEETGGGRVIRGFRQMMFPFKVYHVKFGRVNGLFQTWMLQTWYCLQ